MCARYGACRVSSITTALISMSTLGALGSSRKVSSVLALLTRASVAPCKIVREEVQRLGEVTLQGGVVASVVKLAQRAR